MKNSCPHFLLSLMYCQISILLANKLNFHYEMFQDGFFFFYILYY